MMNPYLLGFRCTVCGKEYAIENATYTCPADGGNLDAVYDYAKINASVQPAMITQSKNRSVWHYAPLLPIQPSHAQLNSHTPLWSFGWSPLYRAPRLEQALPVHNIWLKDDGRLPSSSFKDRASSMVVARALATGVTTITTASTGNAAAALATMCAGTDLEAVIFVPEGTPEGKLAGILAHGATVYAVRGSYDDAVALCNQASAKFGWYNRGTGINPYTREGKKTAAFEICEQLAQQVNASSSFVAPTVVIVPVGDGNIISGIHKGFKDLLALGWIDRMPRFIGVTATLAPTLYRTWQSGTEQLAPAPASTLASGISVELPNDGVMALRAIRETGGTFVEATDEEMLDAMAVLARDAGVFVEPACAAAYVGLVKACAHGVVQSADNVVLQLTGSGLKDTKSALRAVSQPRVISSLSDV